MINFCTRKTIILNLTKDYRDSVSITLLKLMSTLKIDLYNLQFTDKSKQKQFYRFKMYISPNDLIVKLFCPH